MKKFLFALLVLPALTFVLPTYSQAPNWAWAVGVGNGQTTPSVKGMASDAAGNTYLTGFFTDTVRFGSTKLTAASSSNDIFVAKLDHNGTPLWAKRAGGVGEDLGNGIAVDNAGNVYITGGVNGVSGLATFSSITFNTTHNIDAFLAKYDAAGNIQWVQHPGTGVTNYGEHLAIDNANNIYMTGEFGLLMFVAKYGSDGSNNWTTISNNNGVQVECRAIAVNNNGDVFAGGNYYQQLIIGGASIPYNSGYDPYVVKLSASTGSVVWAKYLHGNGDDRGYSLAADNNGNVYFHGITISQKLYYGNDTIFGNNNGGQNVWMVKYSSNGNITWVRQSVGGDVRGGDVSVDPAGDPYLTGYIGTGAFSFGSLNVSGYFSRTYIVKYNSGGTALWIKIPAGNNNYSFATCSSINSLGEVFIAGTYSGTNIFSPSTITPPVGSGSDIFVAKICMTAIPPIVPVGATGLCVGSTLTLTAPAGFASYLWNTSATTQSIVVNAIGNYSVTVTNAEGCSASTSFNVVSNPAIKITKVITPVSCYGGNDGAVNITASLGTPGYTYSWNNGALTPNISGLTVGVYQVTVTDAAGCTKLQNCSVTQPAAPSTVIAAGGPTTVCSPDSVEFHVVAPTGVAYQWQKSNVDIPGATNTTYYAHVSGSYRCKVFYPCGSKQSNIISATIKVQAASITPSGSVIVCNNAAILHTIQGGVNVTYQWYLNGVAIPGATHRNDTVTYNASENYHVVVTSIVTGCSGTSQDAYLVQSCRLEDDATIMTDATIYPNPTDGNFTLQLNNLHGKDLQVTLFDMLGRNIETRMVNAVDEEYELTFDLTSRAAGNYFIRISTGNDVKVLKVLKQ